MQTDNEETGRSESSSTSENSEEDDERWKCGSDPNRFEWVSGTLVQGQQAKDELHKMRKRQGIQKSSLVEEESDMKRNQFEALALLRKRVKEMRASRERKAAQSNNYWWWCIIAIFQVLGRNRYFHRRFCVITVPCV